MPCPKSFFNTCNRGRASRVLRSLVTLILILDAPLEAAQEGKQAQKSQDEVITLKSHLVTTDVMVKDKKGKYVTDLKAEDFTILENGVRQTVAFFDPPLATGKQASADQPAQAAPGGGPMNIVSLVVDGTTTNLADIKQVREGTLKYIRERITGADTVAVFAVSSGLQLLQPFTRDKAKLISAVEKAYASSTSSKNLERHDIAEEIARLREELRNTEGNLDPQSQMQAMMAARALERFTLLRSQMSLQTARPILAALAAICDAQRAIPGKKTLVMFSQGFIASSILDWQVQGTIDMANRANVAIYIIDSAGLMASAPKSGSYVPDSPLAGVAATGNPEGRIRAVGGENVFDNARHEGLNREQDILYQISGDTGGEFIKGNNDISRGLDRIDQQIRSRYTLAYYSTDQNFDGGFRKVKVEVRRPDAQAVARPGYYALANDDIVPLSPADKKLLANFAAAEANPALPFFAEMSPFRSQEGRYIIPLAIEVPPAAVKFDRKGDKQHMHLEFLGVIRERPEKILSRLGGNFDIGLAADQYESVLNNNIFFRQDMELGPGAYDIEMIVRDKLSGKMAARREHLVLPGPDSEFSTSAVVLSRYATAAKNATAGDALTEGGAQIRPSASREFRIKDNLIIFFDLYNATVSPDTHKPIVKVSVTLMKGDKAATKPIDYVLTETMSEPVPHVTFAKYISLAGLSAGKYFAVIEARDMTANKLVTQRVPFVIAQ